MISDIANNILASLGFKGNYYSSNLLLERVINSTNKLLGIEKKCVTENATKKVIEV